MKVRFFMAATMLALESFVLVPLADTLITGTSRISWEVRWT